MRPVVTDCIFRESVAICSIRDVFDNALFPHGKPRLGLLGALVAAMIASVLLGGVLAIVQTYLANVIGQRVIHAPSIRLFARSGRCPGCRQALDQAVDEPRLQEDVVGARLLHRSMQSRRIVAGERDQAEVWVVATEPRDRAHTVEQRHVQIEDGRVRGQFVDELDGGQTVRSCSDDGELALLFDQFA